MGLIIQEYYLSLNFIALYTQSIAFSLILHNFHWMNYAYKLKTRNISPSPVVRNKGWKWQLFNVNFNYLKFINLKNWLNNLAWKLYKEHY